VAAIDKIDILIWITSLDIYSLLGLNSFVAADDISVFSARRRVKSQYSWSCRDFCHV
jgi:hypothetical protein